MQPLTRSNGGAGLEPARQPRLGGFSPCGTTRLAHRPWAKPAILYVWSWSCPYSGAGRRERERGAGKIGDEPRAGERAFPAVPSRRSEMSQLSSITDHSPSPAPAGYRVDPSRGERIGRVSSEWFRRPADERFLNLSDLHRSVKGRAERSRARTVPSHEVRVDARREDGDRLRLMLSGEVEEIAPTHWSFGQLCSLVGAPSGYLRQLPASLAGINLQYGLSQAPVRAGQDLHDGGRPHRTPGRHGPRLRPHPRPRARRGGDAHRRERDGRYALESSRRARLGHDAPQP